LVGVGIGKRCRGAGDELAEVAGWRCGGVDPADLEQQLKSAGTPAAGYVGFDVVAQLAPYRAVQPDIDVGRL